jgi:CheY-like chemotaxis protein
LLVVDDRADNRNLLVGLLGAVGFETREASNGLEAIDVWEAWRPDLIWMDMRMPVMDGEAATREIRKREASDVRGQTSVGETRHCRIVALTASAFEREREAILASGCDDFVTKPFRESTIFEKLAEHIGARFVYEEEVVEERPRGRAVERLGALPVELRAELREAVEEGDVAVALGLVDRIEDTELADELRAMLKRYELDAVISAIDACGAAV